MHDDLIYAPIESDRVSVNLDPRLETLIDICKASLATGVNISIVIDLIRFHHPDIAEAVIERITA